MKTFIVIAFISLVVILLIAFRQQIGCFFGWIADCDGAPCNDTNGNPSRFEDGVCKEITVPNPPAETQQRIILPQYDFPYYRPVYSFPFYRRGDILYYY